MSSSVKTKILGASLGNCVHVAGILNFLKLAQRYGYETLFLGPAVPIARLSEAIQTNDPELIALSYRLTPEALKKLLPVLKKEVEENRWQDKTFIFGGTPPAAEIARKSNLFEVVFSGLEPQEKIASFLKGKAETNHRPLYDVFKRQEKLAVPIIKDYFVISK